MSASDLLASDLSEVVLVDVQWSLTTTGGPSARERYAAAHLPGAHHVDLDAELAGAPGPGGRHPLPTAHAVQEALRRCGADDGARIVVYDQGPWMAAARAWWVLRYFGVEDVRVLDGGLAAWTAASGTTTTEFPEPGAGTIDVHAGGLPVLDAESAAGLARDGVLLDVRAAERYRGEVEPIDPVAGHIPGARSLPVAELTSADGTLRPAAELRELFRAKGIGHGTPVGAYCGSGVTAAQGVLALHEAGVEAALYVGSWSDWVGDPQRPVATGPEPGDS